MARIRHARPTCKLLRAKGNMLNMQGSDLRVAGVRSEDDMKGVMYNAGRVQVPR